MELFGENRRKIISLAVKNSTLLRHYPRTIKYLQNIFKIFLKKTSSLVIRGKVYINNYSRLYLISCRKTSWEKDKIYRKIFSFHQAVFTRFLIVILQKQRCTNTCHTSVMDLLGVKRGWFLAVKNFTVLLHYPRKTKYLQNFFRISLKKTSLSAIEGEIFLSVIKSYTREKRIKNRAQRL